MQHKAVLVVGAGFAGATCARELADRGIYVDVIDQRPHIAGNAYDEVLPEGIRIHRYGPHLFHTNNKTVVEWLTRFGTFVPYKHKVQALLPGGSLAPLPVNRLTLQTVFDVSLPDAAAAEAFLARQAEPIASPANAAEYLRANIGATLTDLFFRPYTKKMWSMDLEEMDAAVVKRIPIRTDDVDYYFPDDQHQMLPKEGYTRIFEAILDHPLINITLSRRFEHAMTAGYRHCFNSMPIDEYFDNALGALPYRSIRFKHVDHPADYQLGTAATVNFTDSGPITRQTDWSLLPCHHVAKGAVKIVTQEEPCDYRDNQFERYYPVKTSDGRYDAIYANYKAMAGRLENMTFIGRCGTYQYLDMHQVINQTLTMVNKWASDNKFSRV